MDYYHGSYQNFNEFDFTKSNSGLGNNSGAKVMFLSPDRKQAIDFAVKACEKHSKSVGFIYTVKILSEDPNIKYRSEMISVSINGEIEIIKKEKIDINTKKTEVVYDKSRDNKLDKIANKLINLGYEKTVFNKPEKSICNNEDEFISKLNSITGDINKSKELSESYSNMLLNDFIPDIEFTSNNCTLEIYLNKNAINIVIGGEKYKVSECNNMEAREVIPFKTIHINDFYNLFIDKNYELSMIINHGNN